MRNKNIFSDLPVEEISIDTVKDGDTTAKRPVHNRNKSKKSKKEDSGKTTDSPTVNEFSKLSISKLTEKTDENNFASIVHKKATGANNWKAFLENSKSDSKDDEFEVDVEDECSKTKITHCVAIDCEMVGFGESGKDNMLARVSIVNCLGECLYDTFVKPTAPVTDYRTAVSGVRPCDLANAEKFSVVQKKVLEIISGKILIGHAVHNDLIVLKIRHPRHRIRDTSRFKKFYQIGVGTPSLKKLTSHFLKVDIQCGEHNSIQDAQAAMQLYMLYRKEWEAEVKKRRQTYLYHHHNHARKKSKTSYKPKRFHKNYKK